MKTIRTLKAAGLLTLASALAVSAQGPREPRPDNRQDEMPPPPLSGDMAAGMLTLFDYDGDGKLDELELKEALTGRPKPPTFEKIAVMWVEEFDADGSGQLSADELAVALKTHQPRKGPEDARRRGERGGPGKHREPCGMQRNEPDFRPETAPAPREETALPSPPETNTNDNPPTEEAQ